MSSCRSVPIISRTVKAGKSCVTRHFGKCFTTCRIMHGPKQCIAEKCSVTRLCLLLSLRAFCVVFRWKESCGRSLVLSTLLQSVLLFSKQSLDVMDCGLASSVRQQNLAQTLSPVAKSAEPHRNTCPLRSLRMTPRMSGQEV